jgi:ribosomal protein S18 acetylase RimI-like enzyme
MVPEKYTLRPAIQEDAAWLEQLRRSVYRELFDLTFGGWDEERHVRHCAECWAGGNIQIIEIAGCCVGMLQLFEHVQALEIGEIQLLPAQQRRGLGTHILRDLQARARAQKRELRLAVALKNERARCLYKRLGFEATSQSETHTHMVYR